MDNIDCRISLKLNHTTIHPLYQQVKVHIRNEITSGGLEQGQRLPSTKQLGKQSSVSWITIEKAYRQLEKEGLVTWKRGLGYFVSQRKLNNPKVLLLLDSLRSYHEKTCNIINHILEAEAMVDIRCYYNSKKIFADAIAQSLEFYQYFAIPKEVLESSECIEIMEQVAGNKFLILNIDPVADQFIRSK